MADKIEISAEILKTMASEKLAEFAKIAKKILVERLDQLKGLVQDVLPDETPAPKKRGRKAKVKKAGEEDVKGGVKKTRKTRRPRGYFTKIAKDALIQDKTLAGPEWRKIVTDAGSSNASTLIQQLEKQKFCKKDEKGNYTLAK